MYKHLVLILLVFCSVIVQAQKTKLFIQDSFEKDDFISNWDHKEACCPYSITWSDSVAREGKYSIRFELNKDDNIISNGKRAELLMGTEPDPYVERWYAFSVFLPADYGIDSIGEILAQWHEIPDFKLGETWRSPPISLQISKDKWKVVVMWATDPVNTNKTISGEKIISLDSFQTGRWTDFVFHIRFSYKENGIIQIWKDNVQVADYTGPNYYNDRMGPYFKMGIYKWGWKDIKSKSVISKRVLYFDRIKIFDESSDYEKMSQ